MASVERSGIAYLPMKIERISEGGRLGWRATMPCKVNLGLQVLGRRTDGYHELDTVMLAVDLVDELVFWPDASSSIHLSLDFPAPLRFGDEDPAWDIPSDGRNLVLKAWSRLEESLGTSIPGRLVLTKRIPAMAGLGGGSSNAAAALVLGLLASNRREWDLVLELARGLGSDLNFFLEGDNEKGLYCARCLGRGERVEPISTDFDSWMVVAHPPIGCSTPKVFGNLTRNDTYSSKRKSDAAVRALLANSAGELGQCIENDLEPAAAQLSPWIMRAASWIDCYDHLGQSMTGSGSARFCLCSNQDRAERISEDLIGKGVRAYAVQPWRQPRLTNQLRSLWLSEA
jgi:4-diphosphocytidyl-2-C-methyl-D-erythritol kinase